MFKLALVAGLAAASNGQYALPLSGLPLNIAAPTPLGAALAYNAAPLGYAPAAPLAAAPLAAAPLSAVPAPIPAASAYALPAPREIIETPIVKQTVEKVEQHGYSIRY